MVGPALLWPRLRGSTVLCQAWRRAVSNKALGCYWTPVRGPPVWTLGAGLRVRRSRGCLITRAPASAGGHVGGPESARDSPSRPLSWTGWLKMRGGQGAVRAPVLQFTNCRILRGRTLLRLGAGRCAGGVQTGVWGT